MENEGFKRRGVVVQHVAEGKLGEDGMGRDMADCQVVYFLLCRSCRGHWCMLGIGCFLAQAELLWSRKWPAVQLLADQVQLMSIRVLVSRHRMQSSKG